MKKTLLLFASMTLAALTFAQTTCPEQKFLPLDGVDPNMIPTDPISGEKIVLGHVPVKTNQTVTILGYACDEDEDQRIAIWCLDYPDALFIDPNTGDYSLTETFPTVGRYYRTIIANDGIVSRVGTWVIDVNLNRLPVLCAGSSMK